MEIADLRRFVEIEEGGVIRRTVFESERLWAQVVSLDRNRSYGPVGDPDADAMVTILAGQAVFQVDRARRRMQQWGSVVVPSGSELVATNASPEPLVLLVVTAPPPSPRAERG